MLFYTFYWNFDLLRVRACQCSLLWETVGALWWPDFYLQGNRHTVFTKCIILCNSECVNISHMITVNVQCFNTFGGILIFSTNHCRCLYLHAWHQAIYIWCDGSYIPQSMTFTVVVSVLGLGMKWVSVLHLLSLFVLNFPAISWCISDFSISTVSMWFFSL